MSNADYHPLPCVADATKPELETLIQRVVEQTLARLDRVEAAPFINSKLSAELIGISPEHLCAMRARGEGPPWSGDGKWIRYRRSDVLDWIANLPRQANPKTINLLGSKGTRVLIPSQFKKKSPHGSKVALFDRGRAKSTSTSSRSMNSKATMKSSNSSALCSPLLAATLRSSRSSCEPRSPGRALMRRH